MRPKNWFEVHIVSGNPCRLSKCFSTAVTIVYVVQPVTCQHDDHMQCRWSNVDKE